MFELGVGWLAWAVDTSVKALLVAIVAALVLKLPRFRDSNVRHRVWTGVLAGMLALPILTPLMPALRLPLVPSPQWLLAWTTDPAAPEIAADNDPADDHSISASAPTQLAPDPDGSSARHPLDPSVDRQWQLPSQSPPRSIAYSPLPIATDSPPIPVAEPAEPAIEGTPLPLTPSPSRTWRQSLRAALPVLLLLAGGAWFSVSALLGLRLAVGVYWAARLRRASTFIDPTGLPLVGSVSATICECPGICVPLTVGSISPRILLPPAWRKWPTDKLRAVLAHEQMHVQRGDCAVALVAEINCCLYWFHPLAWWLKQQLAALAEQACDDAAIHSIGNRTSYARHLLEVAASVSRERGRLAPYGVSMARRSSVETRIHAILDFTRPLSQRLTWTSTLLLLGAMIPVIALAAALKPLSNSDTDAQSQSATESAIVTNSENSDDQKKPIAEQSFTFSGTVVDHAGRPIMAADIRLGDWSDNPARETRPKLAVTDNQGQFQFSKNANELAGSSGTRGWIQAGLIATKDGYGFARGHLTSFETTGRLDAELTDEQRAALERRAGTNANVLKLIPDVPIRGRVLNTEGRPVGGAKIEVLSVWEGIDGSLDAWLAATKEKDADYYSARRHLNHLVSGRFNSGPRAVGIPPAKTDDDGRFTLNGLGRDRIAEIFVSGPGMETGMLHVRSRSGEQIKLPSEQRNPDDVIAYHPSDFTYVAGPSHHVSGRVTAKTTGQPIAGAVVRAEKIATNPIHGSLNATYIRTITDADGRYRLEGLPLGENTIMVVPQRDARHLASAFDVNLSAQSDPPVMDVELTWGVMVRGRITDSRTSQPVAGRLQYFAFDNNPHLEGATGFSRAYLAHYFRSEEDGRYEIPVLPGSGLLTFMADEHQDYPRGVGADRIDGPKSVTNAVIFQTVPARVLANNYHLLTPLNPAPDAKEVNLDLTLASGVTISGRIRAADGQPLGDYYVYAENAYPSWGHKRTGDTFQIKSYFPKEGRRVMIFHPERNLVGMQDLTGEPPADLEIVLRPGGTFVGRLLDADGMPLENVFIGSEWGQADFGARYSPHVAAKRGELPAQLDGRLLRTDKDGRFALHGIIPGLEYSAAATGSIKRNGQTLMMSLGSLFKNVTVESGQTKDLGDLQPKPRRDGDQEIPKLDQANAAKPTTSLASGVALLADGQPAANAHIAVVGWPTRSQEGLKRAPHVEIIADGKTDDAGRFQLPLPNVSAKSHQPSFLIARGTNTAVAWKKLDFGALPNQISLTLAPEEPLRVRLIDIEGRPASGARLEVGTVMKRIDGELSDADNFGFVGDKQEHPAWIAPVVADQEGTFTIHGLARDHGIWLSLEGDDRFSPQGIALNTGLPESRPERDATYRDLVRNVKPGEEVTVPLSPAQIIEGTIRYEDTQEPVANTKVSIWASQQKDFGSMSSVEGQTDAAGRYRIAAKPGIRFGVMAYAPPGAPYLIRRTTEDIRWENGDRVKQQDMTLPPGLLILGKVLTAGTSEPIAKAAVQFIPLESAARPPLKGVVTGWQGIVYTASDGGFEIAVPPGPGHLLVNHDTGSYVLKEIGSRELNSGRPGGQRNYAHAIQKIEPAPDARSLDLNIELQPGATVTGKIVDPNGQPVNDALVVSRLHIWSHWLTWHGNNAQSGPATSGRFELKGLKEGLEYPTHFLDPKRRLGATVHLKASRREGKPAGEGEAPAEPLRTIVLQPCGSATVRFVDEQGQPLADKRPNLDFLITPGAHRYDSESIRAGQLAADADFAANVDRANHGDLKADANGKLTIHALIPGATYAISTVTNGRWQYAKEFQVQSGQTLDLGDVVITPDKRGQAVTAAPPKPAGSTTVTVTGIVLRPDGSPAAGATIRAAAPLYVSLHSLGKDYKTPMSEAKADNAGRFSISFTNQPFGDLSKLDSQWQQIWKKTNIAASLPGFGPAWVAYDEVESKQPITLKLVEDLPIRGRVIDLEGQPIVNTTVKIDKPQAANNDDLSVWLAGIKAGELGNTVWQKAPRTIESRLLGIPTAAITDAEGRFEIRGLGRDRIVGLTFEGESVAHRGAKAVTRMMETLHQVVGLPRISATEPVFGADFTYTADPARIVEGLVRDAKTGQPLAGVAVESDKLSGYPISNHRVLKTTTDAQGRFRLLGMPKGNDNHLLVLPNDDQPYFMREVAVPDPVGLGPAPVEIDLHRGIWIRGRVTDKATGEPVSGVQLSYFPFLSNEFAQKTPEFDPDGNVDGDQSRYKTKADGTFRIVGLPGRAVVGAVSWLKSYRSGVGYADIDAPKYEGSDSLLTYRNSIAPSSKFPNVMKEINPPADATEATVDLQLDPGHSVQISITDPDGKPLTGCSVNGLTMFGSFESSAGSVVTAVNLGPTDSRPILFHHKERNLGLVITIGPNEIRAASASAKLQPCATVVGRVLRDDSAPFAGLAIEPRVLPFGDFGEQLPSVPTDAEGRFQATLLPGCQYALAGMGGSFQYIELAKELSVEPGQTKDLGALTVNAKGKVLGLAKSK